MAAMGRDEQVALARLMVGRDVAVPGPTGSCWVGRGAHIEVDGQEVRLAVMIPAVGIYVHPIHEIRPIVDVVSTVL